MTLAYPQKGFVDIVTIPPYNFGFILGYKSIIIRGLALLILLVYLGLVKIRADKEIRC